MSNYANSKKSAFLAGLAKITSLYSDNCNLTIRSKFNFSYFDSSQPAGQDFKDWSNPQLISLLNKIKNFSENTLIHWQGERCGGGGLKIFTIYGDFPKNSDFTPPSHVPIEAQWARFRLGNKIRLIGFVVPAELHRKFHQKTGEYFDKNTFYVVFLDRDHKFYKPEED